MVDISIIIPTYNRASFLMQAIESVLVQTYQSFEILIVDDFSKDNTKTIVQNYATRFGDQKIKYIKNVKKKGVSGARNTGVNYAKGRYVAFLDSDDRWDKDYLRLKMEMLNKFQDLDVLLSDNNFFGEVEKGYMSAPYTQEVFQENFWDKRSEELLVANISIIPFLLERGSPFRSPSLILKKELLSIVGLFNENMTYYEDADLILRCFCSGKVGYLKRKLCRIRRHNNNVDNMVDNDIKATANLTLVKNIVDYAIKNDIPINKSVLKTALRNAYIRRATTYFYYGKLEESKKSILKSIKIKMCPKAIIRFLLLNVILILPIAWRKYAYQR
ncbi:MAG: glycosyltransferase family 2 protein [Candidatus Thorarchaeota archaeon]